MPLAVTRCTMNLAVKFLSLQALKVLLLLYFHAGVFVSIKI